MLFSGYIVKEVEERKRIKTVSQEFSWIFINSYHLTSQCILTEIKQQIFFKKERKMANLIYISIWVALVSAIFLLY